ncbi:hypothetical protein COLO4_05497 [Corchorus olitorius]|uniref:ABC transporter domain-containing protein n=1 Tax=Corchorus olitorius TaxID=93759 RepID=A0A1R3KQM1_9ROSI|nr:hypothetical protein COLO4_05497 [Corchorus olitorius]
MDYLLRDGFVTYLRDVARISPPIPQQVVRFSGIKYWRKFRIPDYEYETFGNKVVGCFVGPLKAVSQSNNSTNWNQILRGVDGYIMPGSLTLLLGPPGSGKSTLLEVLAGRTKVSDNSILDGTVLYNDRHASEVHLSRLIAYVSCQLNKHIPFLSVRETLEFARDCTQGIRPENFTPQMRKFFAHALVEGQDPFLEYVLEILSLKKIEHKLAGEDISDIDLQRLTTAELALGTYAVMLYDQPFSGSDQAATYDLVDTIRTISRIQQSSAVMSLTQLSEEVFDLFDRIILLADGHIVFQGPRQDAIAYFANLGYIKPSYVDSSEFLIDIVAGTSCQYLPQGATPLTIDELIELYRSSDHYKDIMRIVKEEGVKHTYWIESEPGLGLSLSTPSKYRFSINTQLKRDTELVVAKLSKKVGHSGIESTGKVQNGDVVTAISMNHEEMQYLAIGPPEIQHERASDAYSMLKQVRHPIRLQVERYKEEEENEHQVRWEQFQRPFVQTWWNSTRTLINRQIKITKSLQFLIKLRLFQAVVLGIFAGSLFYKLGGQYDQQKMNSVRALGAVNLPQALAEALIYTALAYFGSSLFFFLSAISSIPEVGNALAGLFVSVFLLFSGFVIYPSNIPIYWKWLLYGNPIHWANVLFCKLQFSEAYTNPCSNYLGQLPFCDQFPTMTVGKAYLNFYELSAHSKKTYLSYLIILGWIILTNFLALLALRKIEFTEISQSLPYIRKTTTIHSYKSDDAQSEFQSQDSKSEQLNYSGTSAYCGQQNSLSEQGEIEENGSFDKWIEEFHTDFERNGLGIPVEHVTLLFEDLSFTRSEKGEMNSMPVFSRITGYASPKRMLVILGGSKTSKATLLECLAGRMPLIGRVSGYLQANSFKTGTNFSRFIGYVEKLDAHQPYLSVRESLQFSAALRLREDISPMSRNIHVELVLNQLGLLPYANQLIGSLCDATGETFIIAKKMTIAVELAANPSILLLEEPIYGLDTIGASTILGVLSKLSNTGRVIIASLTHPNVRTLSFFHLALLLTKEGQQVYFGPLGTNCSELLDYFASIPKAPNYSIQDNPVSYVMGVLGQGIKRRGDPSLNFPEIYQTSSLKESNNNEICSIKNSTERRTSKYLYASTYAAPYSQQFILVLLRTQRFLWRNVQYTYGRLTGCVMIGLLMGSLYFQIEYKDTYSVTSRTLYIYMQVILVGVISANNVIPQIGTDRLVYFRERRTGMYLPIYYTISWLAGEIPYFFIAITAVVGIGNGMAGIATESASQFLMYWITLFMFTLCVTYFGMMITFLTPVPTLPAFTVSIVTSLWVSASGVVVVLSDIKFYRWMYWTNPFQYAMNALTSISFYCNTKNCGPDCRCPRLPDGSYVWDRVAEVRSLSHDRIYTDILILSTMCMLFASLASIFSVLLKHNLAQEK